MGSTLIEEEVKYRAQIRGNLISERYPKSKKNKFLAAALAIVLGSAGIHKFYLGRVGWGVTYILFVVAVFK